MSVTDISLSGGAAQPRRKPLTGMLAFAYTYGAVSDWERLQRMQRLLPGQEIVSIGEFKLANTSDPQKHREVAFKGRRGWKTIATHTPPFRVLYLDYFWAEREYTEARYGFRNWFKHRVIEPWMKNGGQVFVVPVTTKSRHTIVDYLESTGRYYWMSLQAHEVPLVLASKQTDAEIDLGDEKATHAHHFVEYVVQGGNEAPFVAIVPNSKWTRQRVLKTLWHGVDKKRLPKKV